MSNEVNPITSIEATVYSLGEKFNEICTKGRARIFYKGLNRNYTYITEEFADKLMQTIPYTPLKGIWEDEKEDFLDHGEERTQGRIYGVVPESPNFAWENHLDKDGLMRSYACVDVIIYTTIYPEAQEIIGKSLSMELLPSSIVGEYEGMNGKTIYRFTDAAFAGLQVLGDDVEPCFEGAAFYQLRKSAQDLYQKIVEYEMKNGGIKMSVQKTVNFSDEKLNKIWNTLNPDEASQYSIVSATEDSVIVSNCADEYFTCSMAVENDEVVLGEFSRVYCLFMNESEHTAFEELNQKGSFEEITASFAAIENELAEEREKVTSLNETLEAKEAEFTALNDSMAEKDNTIASLTSERDELLEFKCGEERKKKMALCEKYSAKLEDATIQQYTAAIDQFSYDQLESELAVALVKATPSLFTTPAQRIIKDSPTTGIEAILEQYSK